jgi:hypothetical protein
LDGQGKSLNVNIEFLECMLNSYYLIVTKNSIMAKKIKQTSQKSIRKNLLDQVEIRLTESLMDFPKKTSDKKFRKTIRKAGKILTNSLATKPVTATTKSEFKKSKKKKPDAKPDTKVEAAS